MCCLFIKIDKQIRFIFCLEKEHMSNINVQADLPADERLVVSREQTNVEQVPSFSCVGDSNEYINRYAPGYPELFGVLKNLSTKANWFFWSLVEKRNILTNEAPFIAKDRTESVKISHGYKELKDLQLVFRIKQQLYLINPSVMLPKKNYYQIVLTRWNTFV
jgi:hypothetical protein